MLLCLPCEPLSWTHVQMLGPQLGCCLERPCTCGRKFLPADAEQSDSDRPVHLLKSRKQAPNLEAPSLLSLPSCQDYRCAPPHLAPAARPISAVWVPAGHHNVAGHVTTASMLSQFQQHLAFSAMTVCSPELWARARATPLGCFCHVCESHSNKKGNWDFKVANGIIL